MGNGYMMGSGGKESPQLYILIKCESRFGPVYVNDKCKWFIYLFIYHFTWGKSRVINTHKNYCTWEKETFSWFYK